MLRKGKHVSLVNLSANEEVKELDYPLPLSLLNLCDFDELLVDEIIISTFYHVRRFDLTPLRRLKVT
jgi:hypothetical protein